MKICIDPGHGGADPGAVSHNLEEEDFNLIIASMVSCQLRQMGFDVVQTRAFDKDVSLGRRCTIANDTESDLFVSIHANAAENTRAEGMEVFYLTERGQALAKDVLSKMVSRFISRENRGLKQSNFYVLKYTRMPAILIECGFVTNPESADFLKNEDHQVAMATAISQGIHDHVRGH